MTVCSGGERCGDTVWMDYWFFIPVFVCGHVSILLKVWLVTNMLLSSRLLLDHSPLRKTPPHPQTLCQADAFITGDALKVWLCQNSGRLDGFVTSSHNPAALPEWSIVPGHVPIHSRRVCGALSLPFHLFLSAWCVTDSCSENALDGRWCISRAAAF